MEEILEDRGSEAIIMKGCAYPTRRLIKWICFREGVKRKSPGKGQCPNQGAPGQQNGLLPSSWTQQVTRRSPGNCPAQGKGC